MMTSRGQRRLSAASHLQQVTTSYTHTHTYTPLVVAGGNYQPHLCSLAGGVAWQPQRMGLISGEGSRFKLFIFSYFNI